MFAKREREISREYYPSLDIEFSILKNINGILTGSQAHYRQAVWSSAG
jgi:hypothetical protein